MTTTSLLDPRNATYGAREKPQILSVRTAARSRLFHIESVQLKFANGNRREFERIAGGPQPGTALVVAMPDPETVLLVREYAVGLDRFELSLPMGRIEPGESALVAANRELMEETGFRAASLRGLHTLTLAPGIFGYQAEIILATQLTPCVLDGGDEPEPLELVFWPVARLDQIARTGEISEARTLSALFLARSILES
jgi:ADP-ribose diphosphatase